MPSDITFTEQPLRIFGAAIEPSATAPLSRPNALDRSNGVILRHPMTIIDEKQTFVSEFAAEEPLSITYDQTVKTLLFGGLLGLAIAFCIGLISPLTKTRMLVAVGLIFFVSGALLLSIALTMARAQQREQKSD
jgi:hypothetical protein